MQGLVLKCQYTQEGAHLVMDDNLIPPPRKWLAEQADAVLKARNGTLQSARNSARQLAAATMKARSLGMTVVRKCFSMIQVKPWVGMTLAAVARTWAFVVQTTIAVRKRWMVHIWH